MILGLTGGIACGKSVAGRTLGEQGVWVLDADEVSHYLTNYETSVIDAVVAAFGPGILSEHGQIDRRALADRVFAHPPERAKLEQILHPPIKEVLANVIHYGREKGCNIAVIAPLLIEANFQDMVDIIWVISSEERLQAKRLRNMYGFSDIEAYRRINAQLPLREKEAYADYVLLNNGSLEDFKRQLLDTWEQTVKDFAKRKMPRAQGRQKV